MTEENSTPEYLKDALKFGINLGLSRMIRLNELLGDPVSRFRCIHIAGTNGKGSVTTYISSILAASGLKVGVYTSPFLERFSERIRIIDGLGGLVSLRKDECYGEIDQTSVETILERIRSACEQMEQEGYEHPTEFELTTALCYVFFAENNIDVAVLETGLGGRLDATNIIKDPLCTAITAMGMDHSDRLGNTIGEIAGEKAGIFKSGCKALVYDPDESILDKESAATVREVFLEKARAMAAPIEFVGAGSFEVDYPSDGRMYFKASFTRGRIYDTSMPGEHQIGNCALAVACCREVSGKNGISISEDDIVNGVREAVWKGRAECMSTDPILILDGGHNPQGAASLAGVLGRIMEGRLRNVPLRVVMGAMADKDVDGIIRALKDGGVIVGEIYGVTVNNPRSMRASEICNRVKLVYNNGVKAVDSLSPRDAVKQAYEASVEDGMPMLVTGSLYLIGEVRAELKALTTDGKDNG